MFLAAVLGVSSTCQGDGERWQRPGSGWQQWAWEKPLKPGCLEGGAGRGWDSLDEVRGKEDLGWLQVPYAPGRTELSCIGGTSLRGGPGWVAFEGLIRWWHAPRAGGCGVGFRESLDWSEAEVTTQRCCLA